MWLSGKEFSCNAGAARDVDLIPGSGRSPGEDTATHSSILAWRIPWTEEPGGLWSGGLQRVRLFPAVWVLQTGQCGVVCVLLLFIY